VAGFDTGSADLNAHPLAVGGYVTIVGSADRRGQAGENRELGQRRVDAARVFLSRFLIDDDTQTAIQAYSLGAPTEGPILDDSNLRRIDVTVTRRTPQLSTPTPNCRRASNPCPSPTS
jgi:outer membrane protein OmpA-like peptidoglycan-associated protein